MKTYNLKPEDKILCQGRHLLLVDRNSWEFVHRKTAKAVVAIVAKTENDQLLFVEQYRPAVDARVIEFPAGLVGDSEQLEDETQTTAASRELEEETGYQAESLSLLARGPATAGASSEIIDFYYAHHIVHVGEGGGVDGEDIKVHLVPSANIDSWLRQKEAEGMLVDLKVYTGLYFWLRSQTASPNPPCQ